MAGKSNIGSGHSGIATIAGQLFRYAFIGVLINVAAYLLYLWLTGLGLNPKAAATICFVVALCTGFASHRRWTFGHAGDARQTSVRYIWAYGTGYAFNMFGLYLLVDVLRYPHEIVQGGLVLAIAAGLFIAQKFWIFAAPAPYKERDG